MLGCERVSFERFCPFWSCIHRQFFLFLVHLSPGKKIFQRNVGTIILQPSLGHMRTQRGRHYDKDC